MSRSNLFAIYHIAWLRGHHLWDEYISYKHNVTELEADNGEMNRNLAAYELKLKFAGSDE